jgi:hypothetical protein
VLWTSPATEAATRPLTSKNGSPRDVEERNPGPDRKDVGVSEETYEGGPVAALRRIAFLLERSRADT